MLHIVTILQLILIVKGGYVMTVYIKRDDILSYIYAMHSAGGFKCENDYLWLHDKVINADEYYNVIDDIICASYMDTNRR